MIPVTRLSRIKTGVVSLLVVLTGIAVFLTLYTPAAAQFADQFLRPVLGASRVVYMEKCFFYISDRIQQRIYRYKSPRDPLVARGTGFASGYSTVQNKETELNLEPIPSTHRFSRMSEEGVWQNRPLAAFPNQIVMARTFVRPDPDRVFAIVTLAQFAARHVFLGAVAGKDQPGGPLGRHGPGVLPLDIVRSGRLLAAFAGGFQYRDGEYGMIVGDTTYVPLKNDLGTLVGYRDGSLKIFNYRGESIGKDVAFVRQNCPILIDGGKISSMDPEIRALWGRTLTSDMHTWRSGIGLTREGNILYAVGNNLNPTTLAMALRMGGAVDAIQLDINPYWVRFDVFDAVGNGRYNSIPLMEGLQDGSRQFLRGYEKDFFYLYTR